MHTRSARFLLFALFLIAPALVAQTPAPSATTTYLRPPQPIVDAFDAQPLPQTILSPTRQLLALTYHKGQPGIAELAQPVLRLAGARVNPKTYGPHRTPLIYG